MESYKRLLDIMHKLRAPGGCPWDAEQTPESLKPYIIEEAYEVLDAIDRQDKDLLIEELGDLMLQVVFQAEIAQETKAFDMAVICEKLGDKLIRRHPHVFGDKTANNSQEALSNWESLKRKERKAQKKRHLDGVPKHLPGLLKAFRLTEKAARVGFDWQEAVDVLPKLKEELGELEADMLKGNQDGVREEFGDLMFVLANLGRKLGLDPEDAVQNSCRKFTDRFNYIEDRLNEAGEDPEDKTLEELDALWDAAKKQGL